MGCLEELPMFKLMQGDEYYIPIEIKDENGDIATEKDFDEIEVSIGDVIGTMSGGKVKYDSEKQVFLFRITQEETLTKLGKKEKVQIRVKTLYGDVIGINIGEYSVIPSQSKAIL